MSDPNLRWPTMEQSGGSGVGCSLWGESWCRWRGTNGPARPNSGQDQIYTEPSIPSEPV